MVEPKVPGLARRCVALAVMVALVSAGGVAPAGAACAVGEVCAVVPDAAAPGALAGPAGVGEAAGEEAAAELVPGAGDAGDSEAAAEAPTATDEAATGTAPEASAVEVEDEPESDAGDGGRRDGHAGTRGAIAPWDTPSARAARGGAQTDAAKEREIAELCTLMTAAADRHGVPHDFFIRLIWKESRFNAGAVSPVGAQGIAQFMPGTARLRGLKDPFDRTQALDASASFLADMADDFGSWGLAAIGYNGGPNRVEPLVASVGGLPYETIDYVYAITGRTAAYWAEKARRDRAAMTRHVAATLPGAGDAGRAGAQNAAAEIAAQRAGPAAPGGGAGETQFAGNAPDIAGSAGAAQEQDEVAPATAPPGSPVATADAAREPTADAVSGPTADAGSGPTADAVREPTADAVREPTADAVADIAAGRAEAEPDSSEGGAIPAADADAGPAVAPGDAGRTEPGPRPANGAEDATVVLAALRPAAIDPLGLEPLPDGATARGASMVRLPLPRPDHEPRAVDCHRLVVALGRAVTTAPPEGGGLAQPWAAQVAGHPKRAIAMQQYARIRGQLPGDIVTRGPTVVVRRFAARGRMAIHAVQFGAKTRGEAEALCRRIAASRTPCVVVRNG